MSLIFEFILAKADILLDGFFQFLRANTDVSLSHIHTGMLEQGSDQFDVVMIVHIHVCCESFAETVGTYPIEPQIRAYCFQMLQ